MEAAECKQMMSAVGLCSPVERGATLDEWEYESAEPGGAWAGCVRRVSAQARGSCAWVQGVRKEVDESRQRDAADKRPQPCWVAGGPDR